MTETVTEALESLVSLFGKRSLSTSELLPPEQQIEEIGAAMLALDRVSQPVDTGVGGAMTHSEALDAIVGAAGVTTLSYQEAIEGYLRLREMGQ